MENLAPSLQLLLEVRSSLQQGQSVRSGILNFMRIAEDSEFRKDAHDWLVARDQGRSTAELEEKQISSHRRVLLKVLERGLRGESINQALQSLQQEMILACEAQIEDHCKRVGFYILIPLLLLQFPAMLILLLGPILANLMNSMTQM